MQRGTQQYRNEFLYWGILSICKRRRITHKLNKAQRAYIKFVRDLPVLSL